MSMDLADGKIDQMHARTLLAKAAKTSRGISDIEGRIELYQLVGHSKSLAGVRVSVGTYSVYKGVEFKPPKVVWTVEKEAAATALSNWPRELAGGDTKAQALANFKEKFDEIKISPPASKEATFEVYSRRGEKGYWVGKKVGRNPIFLAGPFETVKEARTYKDSHNAELTEKLEKSKEVPSERRATNQPRVGEDMRGGADVTPQMFEEAFAFKGVQFGNYMEQGRRQKDLNDAYDALMDMAAVLGVPPKALSLNGELGLAFGARGKGGKGAATAHYESDRVVINLTKREGAGSLGHEWWHALDNYFSRMRAAPSAYMTDGSDVSLAARGADFTPKSGMVRREMIQAFGEVMKAIRSTAVKVRSGKPDAKRAKAYWTTGVEMSARAYESYLISKLQDQGASNDYLANIVDEATWAAAEKLGFELEGSYPYPTAGEVPAIRAAFDHFFQVVETRETDQGVAMFSRRQSTKEAYEARIDALFAGEKAAGPREGVKVLDRSDVLALLGFGEGPVHLAEGKVIKGRESHPRMTAEAWKKVPEWLENPAAVFDSDTVPDRLTMIAPDLVNGNLVLLAVEPNANGTKVHILVNAYNKDGGHPPVARWLRDGLGRLVDQKTFPTALERSGLRLSSSAWQNKPGTRKILTEKNLAGYRRNADYSFAGPRARTSDKHTLAAAQRRIEAGDDTEAVRRDTGWHRGADGKWRFEISDSDATLKPLREYGDNGEGRSDTLENIIDHPALFTAYPSLRNLWVNLSTHPNDTASGSYSDATKGDERTVGRSAEINVRAGSRDEALSTLLHEIQHGIQNIEGFATGGSPQRIATIQDAARDSIADLRADVREAQRKYDDAVDMGYPDATVSKRRAALDAAQKELADNEALANAPEAGEQYKRLAGEVEARNTQTRQRMSDAERRAAPPSQTADVADADVVVSFNGQDAAHAPTPANARKSATGLPPESVTRVADAMRAKWDNGPEVVVVESIDDAAVPAQVREAAESKRADTGDFEAEGFFHDGTVYLVADQLDTEADVARVLLHEAAGHYGLRGLFGKRLGAILDQIIRAKPKAVADKMREYGLTGAEGRRLAAEEVLASMAQTNPKAGFVRRAIAAVRAWLRDLGLDLKMSDSEIIAHVLVPARQWVESGAMIGGRAKSPAFSARTGGERDAFVSEALAELAANDELFRYPTSKSATLDGVMADVFPEAQYLGEDTRPDERQESGADARHVVRGANGKMAYIFERGNEVWLDISRFQEGDRGDGVYATAMNYAHNAGKRFIGDPAGLSEAAVVRRTSAMLSSALRFGTTKHMEAAPEQVAGIPEKGIAPLKWQGDDLAKTTALIDSFLSTLYTQFPALKGYRYDFRKGQFLDRSGRPVGLDRFTDARRLGVARAAKAGSATARRGIFLQSLVSSEGSKRPELLEHILRRGRALTAEGGPARAMFSRRQASRKVSDSIADLFQSSKNFNWWHRSIGTQYEKAQKNAHFRRVFEASQRG